MPSESLSNRSSGKTGLSPQTMTDNEADLTFDDVAKFFPLPIAEAASLLGVCSAFLKRMCRENGVPRWPYRKILAGKTVEDIKREAAREKKFMDDMARRSLQQHGSTFGRGTQLPAKGGGTHSDSLRWQSRGPAPGSTPHPPPMRLHIDHRPLVHQQYHLRINIPTYLDELRYGFPKKGLSAVSNRWWGNTESDKREDQNTDGLSGVAERNGVASTDTLHGLDVIPKEHQTAENAQISCSKLNSKGASKEQKITDDFSPGSLLLRTRKKAAVNGKKALGLAVTRGYGAYRLSEKDEAVLASIFEDFLPDPWKAFLSNRSS